MSEHVPAHETTASGVDVEEPDAVDSLDGRGDGVEGRLVTALAEVRYALDQSVHGSGLRRTGTLRMGRERCEALTRGLQAPGSRHGDR